MNDDLRLTLAIANAPLTPGERSMLERLSKDLVELEYSKGGGWWIEDDQVSGRVAWSLIRRAAVKKVPDTNATIERYHITDIGRARLAGNNAESVLAEETFEP